MPRRCVPTLATEVSRTAPWVKTAHLHTFSGSLRRVNAKSYSLTLFPRRAAAAAAAEVEVWRRWRPAAAEVWRRRRYST